VVNSVRSPKSKRSYAGEIQRFLQWFANSEPASGFTRTTIQTWRSTLVQAHLAPSTINLRLTVVRRLASEAASQGLLAMNVASEIAAVKGVRAEHRSSTNSSPITQPEEITLEPVASSLRGKRDHALFGVMMGCRLNSAETARLTLEQIQKRHARWIITGLIGKQGHIRAVSVPGWAKHAVDAWVTAAGLTGGRVFRPVTKRDTLSTVHHMTNQAVFRAVKGYASALGMDRRFSIVERYNKRNLE
jgi:integrase/recombinase XerD